SLPIYKLLELDYLAVGLRLIGLVLSLIGGSALAALNFNDIYSFSAGGVVGDVISSSLLPYFNLIGTTLLLLTFLCTGLTLVTGISWIWLADKLGEVTITGTLGLIGMTKKLVNKARNYERPAKTDKPKAPENLSPSQKTLPATTIRQEPELDLDMTLSALDDDEPFLDEQNADDSKAVKEAPKKADDARFKPKSKKPAAADDTTTDDDGDDAPVLSVDPLPSIELLDRPNKTGNPLTPEELQQISQTVE